ncbi:MAG: OmpA family protein [Taibaiella sp.]|nr:OmpA family protein [Taibaiella sp.]
MKKLFFLLIAASGALSAFAQAKDSKTYKKDAQLPRWVIDVNLMGGMLTQDITTTNSVLNYTKALNSSGVSGLKFENGMSYGGNAQIGFFFDNKSHFGIGTGIMYLMQTGDVTMDKYKVEYQSNDANGNIFRQVITATAPVKEALKITNVSIPVVLKYKNRFTRRSGIAIDGGLVYNAMMKNSYTTNANFNYEAIYKHVNTPNGIATVYDNGAIPGNTDLLITEKQFLATHPGGNVADYFTTQRNIGYNVGWGVEPTTKEGDVNFVQSSVGFLFQPSYSYYFNDKVALNIGGYFMYQMFSNAPNSSRLTDKVGEYNSFLNNSTTTTATSYGGNLGLRFYFSKFSDRDKDGVPNRFDKCPWTPGIVEFDGCPDTDGDGIPDAQDSCIDVPGLKHFNGCPDSDGDGIPNYDDACPYQSGPAKFMGCPDTDNDGIPDSEDKCPNEAGPESNDGCPIPPPPPPPLPPPAPIREHDMSEPILFEVGKAKISDVSLPILAEAIMELNTHENAFIMIDGHTDITGGNVINDALSYRRANAVRKYLIDMGANPKHMIAVGHGSREPVADNKTAEGRAKNRRVIMTLKHR